jgi:hypothetical protein
MLLLVCCILFVIRNNDGVIDIEEFLGIMKATSIY